MEVAAQRAELDALLEGYDDEIKAELLSREVDELKAGKFTVKWTPYTSNRFDTTGFKAVHADIYQQFVKPTETRRFTIS